MRTFIAIGLPEHLRERLDTLLGELRRCGADVRWVNPGSIHLTLKFLGEIDPNELGKIDEALRKTAARAAPTHARLRGMGSFPHLRRPRVIWVGLHPADDRLAALQAAVDQSLEEIGFPREKRGFHPHLTLGRVRSGRGKGSLVEAVESRGEIDLGQLDVASMTLYESSLSPRGATYAALGEYLLGG